MTTPDASQHPGAPPPPQGPAGFPGSPARPKEVDNAFVLAIISEVITLVFAATAYAMFGPEALTEVLHQMEAQGIPVDPAAVRFGAIAAIALVQLAWAALWLFAAFMMRAGRNWARVLLTVLASFRLLRTMLIALSGGFGLLVSFIHSSVLVAVLFFMYQPASNAYFNAARSRL
jgi:hypothetical protein